MKKKKVGILTFHRAENFGAVLQAYALQKYIISKGVECEIIDYISRDISEKYKLIINKKLMEYKKSPYKFAKILLKNILSLKKRLKIKNIYNKFIENFLILSKDCYKDKEEFTRGKLKYDIYITGSDQVWSDEFIKVEDKTFFLDFVTNKIKVAYAASSGGRLISEQNINYIKDFNYISVRETCTQKFLKNNLHKPILRVCDPVFLLTKSEWEDSMYRQEKKLNEKYIFIYNIWTDMGLVNMVNTVADKMGCKVICFNNKEKFKNVELECSTSSPEEIFTLIKNAEYVITSSFHGAAFSIILNKQFITYLHPETGERMLTLLNTFNLNERIVASGETVKLNKLKEPINYNEVNEIIAKERETARIFLHQVGI